MVLAAARNDNIVPVTIGVILLLIALIGIILLANWWTSHSKRERGIPKERRRRKGGRHADKEEGK